MKDWMGRVWRTAVGGLAVLGLCLLMTGGPALAETADDGHGATAHDSAHADDQGAMHGDGHGATGPGEAAHGEGGGEGAHGDGHGGGEHSGGLPQLDAKYFPTQLFWLALTFLLLYFLSAGAALPKIAEIIETRESRIAHDLDRADELKNEAARLARETEEILANARSRARAMVTKALEEADEDKVERLAQVETEIVRRLADAELRIQEEKMKALSDASSVAVDIAQSLAERLVGAKPDQSVTRQAVETVRNEGAAA